MATNDFNKEERVAFEKLLEGFEDALELSRAVTLFKSEQTMMERTGDVLWRPMPYIMTAYEGRDMTGKFGPNTQRSVPTSIGYEYAVPFSLTATELRDALQEDRLGSSAKEQLASKINTAVARVAAYEGTIVSTKASAFSEYDDVAIPESMMDRVGIPSDGRYMFMPSGSYKGLAKDLAGRADMSAEMSQQAYRRSRVGMVAGFNLHKLMSSVRLPESTATGVTMDTRSTANNWYLPRATAPAATAGGSKNIDNRYQTITVSDNSLIAAGDCFNVAGITEVHHINKEDTGELKTFRVIEKLAANQIVISPPIVSGQGGNHAEEQYQNVTVVASATAAISFLNITTKAPTVFWHKEAIELHPSRYVIPSNSGIGVMRGSTDQGIEVTMTKQTAIETLDTLFRCDVRFGVTMVQPEMAGIALPSQT